MIMLDYRVKVIVVRNGLAYYDVELITAVKSFTVLIVRIIKLLFSPERHRGDEGAYPSEVTYV